MNFINMITTDIINKTIESVYYQDEYFEKGISREIRLYLWRG
ncbi:hypothetical protein HNQ88_001819 [Aureibacter tunicatorum]|uniref:Uncharacterized protein n=1 Tax=Aureibacter tunicatorum TaxID=866807 RepID=A0AAE4BSU0_9BACT|nr:hypothetical protein [Aureibacter tunicatorum]BDD05288.1 hypothetical protein AUTU_27710 [Aureibacter tunicatorum]